MVAPAFIKSRQQIVIEFAPKFRILFGRPFVKQEDWTFFEQTDDQRQTPALAARKIERTKLAIRQSGFVAQTELRQQAVNLARIRLGYPVKSPEQMIVEENRRHQSAIIVASIVVDVYSVERDFAGIRRIKSGQNP